MGKSKEENIRDMGVINKGQTLVIINGGHGLMGGTLWELSKLMIFVKNLVRSRSSGECLFSQIFNDQQ